MTVVQRSPDVGLALRMQRLPQAAPPVSDGGGGDGSVIGVAMFVEASDDTGSWSILKRQYWDWRVTGGDIDIHAELTLPVRVLLVGGGASVDWTWSLDYSHMGGVEGVDWEWGGVSVTLQDGTALVRVLPGNTSLSDFSFAKLTMVASIGGEPVDEATLRLTFNSWMEDA